MVRVFDHENSRRSEQQTAALHWRISKLKSKDTLSSTGVVTARGHNHSSRGYLALPHNNNTSLWIFLLLYRFSIFGTIKVVTGIRFILVWARLNNNLIAHCDTVSTSE
jgi:hypothetical protein